MKIALLPFYIKLYDDILPSCGRQSREFARTVAAELARRGLDVFEAPVCRLHDEFADALRRIREEGCSAIATLHLAYSPSLESAELLATCGLPLVVLDTTPDFSFDVQSDLMPDHGIHGVQDFCNLLIRHGKPFLLSAGHWKHSDCLDRAVDQLKAASLAWKTGHIRVGKVGGNFDGMGDFRVPEGTFGMTVVPYRSQPEPEEKSVLAEMEQDRLRFQPAPGLSGEAHARTIRASLKLRNWAEREHLDAFTVCFCGITRQDGWDTVPFLECSKAMARGLGYAGEGDVLTAAVNGCLAGICRDMSFTEMFCPDWKGNRIFTSHMGEINPAVCEGKPCLNEMDYHFSDTGNPVLATGCFKAGEALLVNLAPGPTGTFTLITSCVSFLETQGNIPTRNSGWFTPRCGSVADFLAAYSAAGGTHHLAACYGADARVMKDWAKLMKWNFAEI